MNLNGGGALLGSLFGPIGAIGGAFAGTGGGSSSTAPTSGTKSPPIDPTTGQPRTLVYGNAGSTNPARAGLPSWTKAPNGSYYGSTNAISAGATPKAAAGTQPLSYGGDAGTPTYGTESGPGIMQQWFGERATGTDPGYEYTTGRGVKALDSGYASRGMYNSGASEQADSDYLANMGAQREGQLDQLAAGASGERANQLNTMLGLGTGLAGAQAGLGGTYDVTGANAMGSANNAGLQYGAQGAMIPYLANQGLMNNLFGLGSMAAFGGH